MTKDGSVAGPRVLEHLVDCVLQFEGDRYHAHRILRAVKNRFGSTNELGVFEMTGDRARRRSRPVGSSSAAPTPGEIGAAVACVARGHAAAAARDPVARRADRPRDAAPRRHRRRPEAARDDRRRARPARRACRSARADVFVNVAGGVRIDEPGADLGIALAIASAAKGVPGPRGARRLRRDRPHRPAAAGHAGRPPGRGMPQVRPRERARAGRHERATARGRDAPGRAGRGTRREARLSRDFSEKPCKNGGFTRVSATLVVLAGRAFRAAGTFATTDGKRRQLVQGRRQGGVSRTTVQARS